jgi:hypothetical protein
MRVLTDDTTLMFMADSSETYKEIRLHLGNAG